MKTALAKSFLIILISLISVTTGAAQNVCDLSSKTAPLLLNLSVGASPEQTRAMFGKDLKLKIKKKGERTFFQNYIKKPAPVSLRGVRALYLRFFDRQLYQIEIFYEPRADLPTLEATVNALSSQLNLSTADWLTRYGHAQINCGAISLATDYVLNPRVQLTDETAFAAVEAARKKDKKK